MTESDRTAQGREQREGQGQGGGQGEGQGLEAHLARLESIVEQLERDDLDLEAALALFEEGVARAREANGLLEKTRLRVERLVVEMDGSVGLHADPDDE